MSNWREEQDALWEALSMFDYPQDKSLPKEVEDIEKHRINHALVAHDGNKSQAAKDLGIGRTNLIAKCKKYNIA